MRLKDFDTRLLAQLDQQIYEEALRLSRDCNRWMEVYDLAGRCQSSSLESMLLHTSNVMKQTLDYYDNEEIRE